MNIKTIQYVFTFVLLVDYWLTSEGIINGTSPRNIKNEYKDSYEDYDDVSVEDEDDDSNQETSAEVMYNPEPLMVFVSLLNYLKSIRLQMPYRLFKKFNRMYTKHRKNIKQLRLAHSILDVYKHEVARNGFNKNLANLLNITNLGTLRKEPFLNLHKNVHLSNNIKNFIMDSIKGNSSVTTLFQLADTFNELANAIKKNQADLYSSNLTKWNCHCFKYADDIYKDDVL